MEDQITVELLKWGMGGAVLIVVFWKFVPTLFDFLRRDKDHDGRLARLEQIATANKDRLEHLESEYTKLRDSIADIRTSTEVSTAILKRIEEAIGNRT